MGWRLDVSRYLQRQQVLLHPEYSNRTRCHHYSLHPFARISRSSTKEEGYSYSCTNTSGGEDFGISGMSPELNLEFCIFFTLLRICGKFVFRIYVLVTTLSVSSVTATSVNPE